MECNDLSALYRERTKALTAPLRRFELQKEPELMILSSPTGTGKSNAARSFMREIALGDENHLSTVIGLNKCACNILTFARARLSAQGLRRIKFRSSETERNARLLSYQATVDLMANDILIAVDCIVSYLAAEPEGQA